MADRWSKTIAEILRSQLDSSDIYESEAYRRLEKEATKRAAVIYERIDPDAFADYREARIDLESLFYKFGFMDGVRFFQRLTGGSSNELLDEINNDI